MGYHRAGFDVVGVDNRPMPRFPFEFHQADALEFLADHGREFDVIHASPPCQRYSVSTKRMPGKQETHADILPEARRLLIDSGQIWVIENVIGAPMRTPVMLCGSMFGIAVRRHRLFESNVVLFTPGECCHQRQAGKYPAGRSRSSSRKNESSVVMVYGGGGSRGSLRLWSEAMGINWMTQGELSQAIPPAYTECVGRQLIGML